MIFNDLVKTTTMADNKNMRHGRDRNLVSSSQPYEVRYLSEKFGVEKEIVLDAIQSCGNDRSKIEEYLNERTGRGRGGSLGGSQNPPV
jgi:hypothetical protein